jgi:hypothetical protein
MKFPPDTTFPATVSESKDNPGMMAFPSTTKLVTVSDVKYEPFPIMMMFPRFNIDPVTSFIPP